VLSIYNIPLSFNCDNAKRTSERTKAKGKSKARGNKKSRLPFEVLFSEDDDHDLVFSSSLHFSSSPYAHRKQQRAMEFFEKKRVIKK
jgi:hypothetical protein